MYRIKTDGTINLVISDIKVSVSAVQTDGVLVSKEKIDNSKEAQKLIASKLLIVEDVTDEQKSKKATSKTKVAENTIFVSEGNSSVLPNDVFVKQKSNETKKQEIKQVSAKNTKVEDTQSAPIVVADLNSSTNEETVSEVNVSEKNVDEVIVKDVEESNVKETTKIQNNKTNKKQK